MKIGITGSLSSGKSSVAKILSNNSNLLFSADIAVQDLYKSNLFKRKISKKFKLNKVEIKKEIKEKLLSKKISLKDLGNFIHPAVRTKMKNFYKKNKNKKILFFEIPLLIESKLMNYFDYIILVVAPRKQRLKRYIKKGGNERMFNLLDKGQISPRKKVKFCDYLIVNNKSKIFLKRKVNDIINLSE